MPRHFLVAGAICAAFALSASVALAKPGVVKTKAGQTIEGDITEKGDGTLVVTTKSNLAVTLQSNQIENVTYAEDIKSQYQQRLAKLPANAVAKDHVDLARWLFENRSYDLARQELDKAQAKDPNSSDAALLRQTVERNAAWEKRAASTPPPGATVRQPAPAGPAPGTASPAPAPGAAAPAGAAREQKFLSADDINKIKQQEIQKSDAQLRIRFEADVLRKLATHANMNIREIQPMPDLDKLLLVFEKGDAEMRKSVKVVNDPAALLQYKQRIQPILLQGCAAAGCHTPHHNGSIVLHQGGGDPATYTNFYTLTQYKQEGGAAGQSAKLINRTYPAKSLILQYGLPMDQAEMDHPEVQNYKPTFRSAQDLRYQEVLRWIQDSLATLEPNYDIDFPLPGAKMTAQPTNAAPANQPPPPPANQQQNQQNQNQQNRQQQGTSPEDALKDARERMRPIRPTIPF